MPGKKAGGGTRIPAAVRVCVTYASRRQMIWCQGTGHRQPMAQKSRKRVSRNGQARACSPGTPSRISKEAFVAAGAPGVVTWSSTRKSAVSASLVMRVFT